MKFLYSRLRTRDTFYKRRNNITKYPCKWQPCCQLLVRILLRTTTFQQWINFPVACQVRRAKAGRSNSNSIYWYLNLVTSTWSTCYIYSTICVFRLQFSQVCKEDLRCLYIMSTKPWTGKNQCYMGRPHLVFMNLKQGLALGQTN